MASVEQKNAMRARIEKALEVRTSLENVGICEEICHGLKDYFEIQYAWVKDGIHSSGRINLPEIKKTLVYKLVDPKQTVVKLTSV